MKTVRMDVTYGERASRLELIIRFLWCIPLYIVATILGIVGMICFCLQWLYILFLGKRHRTLHEWIVKYLGYAYKMVAYALLATEERPPIAPESE